MNNENEIVEDLKNWKEIIKPYATPETKLAKNQIYNTFTLCYITNCGSNCI
jgi:omega-6 fatty acid desaturase (delta-12 desaturase)